MTGTTLRRTGALLTSATLLAALLTSAIAAPVSAAKPRCAGKVATIVGTNQGEVIRGTRRADVIAARKGNDRIYGGGGNDIICGGPGHDLILGGPGIDRLYGALGRDRLYGGKGPDRLFGGAANDKLDGGIGRDACFQGLGTGRKVRCELPQPTPAPVSKVLAIAYSNLDGSPGYHYQDLGQCPHSCDVLIAKLVDTDGNGPDAGDRIDMGYYLLHLQPEWPTDFKAWGVSSHTVTAVEPPSFGEIQVLSANGNHEWHGHPASSAEYYSEAATGGVPSTVIQDGFQDPGRDLIETDPGSPSQPGTPPWWDRVGTSDELFIDVDVYYQP
jgi:hypothetical protein